jgi:hypothetical protein
MNNSPPVVIILIKTFRNNSPNFWLPYFKDSIDMDQVETDTYYPNMYKHFLYKIVKLL